MGERYREDEDEDEDDEYEDEDEGEDEDEEREEEARVEQQVVSICSGCEDVSLQQRGPEGSVPMLMPLSPHSAETCVFLPEGYAKESADIAHLAGVAKHSPPLRVFGTDVAESLFRVIEVARVDRIASEWFGRDILGYYCEGKSSLVSAATTAGTAGRKPVPPRCGCDTHIEDYRRELGEWQQRRARGPVTDTLETAYGVVKKSHGPVVQAFASEIREAVESPTSEKAMATAARIAAALKTKWTPPPPPPLPMPTPALAQPTSGGGGKPSQQPKEMPKGEAPPPKPIPEGVKKESDRIVSGALAGEALSRPKTLSLPAGAEAAAAQLMEGARETLKTFASRQATAEESPSFQDMIAKGLKKHDSAGEGQHKYRIAEVEQRRFRVSERVRLKLSQWKDNRVHRPAGYTGNPTPSAWRMGYGHMRVFRKPVEQRGIVAIMVDLSGSMGSYWQPGNSGYLAFAVATCIGEMLDNQVHVYGFCSNERESLIVPIAPGYAPAQTDGEHYGNPDCVALQFLADTYADLNASVAVMVSDGSPAGPSPLGDHHLVRHTRQLALGLHEAGLRYVSVLCQSYDYGYKIYPADITVRISSVDDMWKIGEAVDAIIGQ